MRTFLTSITLLGATLSTVSSFATPPAPVFAMRSGGVAPSPTQLFSDVDSSAEVKAAMEATEKYGAQSPEARVAWDIVEEIDASKSHTKIASDDNSKPKEEKKKSFVVSTRKEALAEAEAITKEKGITSPEARLAWELVEELAATESHHTKYGTG